jgi:2-keto-3-deoxy-L-arabinonate dehydratase
MKRMSHTAPQRGMFPVVPTIFDEGDALDPEGQRRAVDTMMGAG